MDHSFCPGARLLRQPKPELFPCPSCGAEVEIWSDELRAACPSCHRSVFRNGLMSCLEWCKYGRDCVGEEIYQRYQRGRALGLRHRLEGRLAAGRSEEQRRFTESVLAEAELLLQEEPAQWHIVIPACMLHDERTARGDSAAERPEARRLLRETGLPAGDIEEICRVLAAAQDRVPAAEDVNARVARDARLLAGLKAGRPQAGEPVTETGRRLASRYGGAT